MKGTEREMEHRGSVVLRTERLLLRPFRADDAQQAYENWLSDPEVAKYLTWQPYESVELARAVLAAWEKGSANPEVYHWAIVLDGEVVGDISVVSMNEKQESCQTGYCLSRKHWGKGIMTEAYAEVLRFLFEEVGVYRVAASHAAQNVGSGKVMEKCGLAFEGVARKALRLHASEERADVVWRAILREDYFARK